MAEIVQDQSARQLQRPARLEIGTQSRTEIIVLNSDDVSRLPLLPVPRRLPRRRTYFALSPRQIEASSGARNSQNTQGKTTIGARRSLDYWASGAVQLWPTLKEHHLDLLPFSPRTRS